MNLRSTLKGLCLILFFALMSSETQAQAQLAGINQDGLMQLGANHPFVVDEYVIDISPLGISTVAEAVAAFEIYTTEGYMSFTHDMSAGSSTMRIQTELMAHGQVSVADMNKRLRDIHRLKR